MKFFDRTVQLEQLAQMRQRSYEDHSMLTVVTGRRRIGKTTLVDKSMDGEPYLYFFVGKKTEAVLCEEFTAEIRTKLDLFVPDGIIRFRDLFAMLMQEGLKREFTLVIDEFQNFTDINPSIFSDIQNYWDKFRLVTHVNFIVSGSVYSLMTRLFKDRREPLYGRDDLTIKLQPFPPAVLKEILREYAPEYTNEDLLALYTYTGAVPKYIELLVDAGALTVQKMIRFICRADSPFIDEGRKLLIQEFGRNYETYFSILEAIAQGSNTQASIASKLGDKSIGGQLMKLEDTYNLIDKRRPMWAGDKTQTVRFEISDVFLRFWFRYIEKNQMLIEISQYPLLEKIMHDDYTTYTGDVLERYFRAKLIEGMQYRALGSWWNPKGYIDSKGNHQQGEIDIVAIHTDDRNADIIEVKRDKDRFCRGLVEEKTEFFKSKEKRIRKYRTNILCLTIEDM